jgi:hypothetical protein
MLDIYCVNKSPTCQEVGEAARQLGALGCDALAQGACVHRHRLPHRRDCGVYRGWPRSVRVARRSRREQGQLWDRRASATALLGDTASRRQPSGCSEISQRPAGCALVLPHLDSRSLLQPVLEPIPRAIPAAVLLARRMSRAPACMRCLSWCNSASLSMPVKPKRRRS